MISGFDKARLEEITGGDVELERTLLSLFAATAESVLARLQAGEDWATTVHELKGAAANLGAEALHQKCAELQHALPAEAEREALFALIRSTLTAIK